MSQPPDPKATPMPNTPNPRTPLRRPRQPATRQGQAPGTAAVPPAAVAAAALPARARPGRVPAGPARTGLARISPRRPAGRLALRRPADRTALRRPTGHIALRRPADGTALRRPTARMAAAGLVLALGAALAGCGGAARASGPAIELDTAYVNVPGDGGSTDAFLVIRDNGPADKLISARSSAGGTVTFSGPVGGNPAVMRAVPSITIPGHTLVRLVPNGYHLVISDSGPMKSGTEITLTLHFAHSGTYQVPAQVTNPQTGGASYFLN
jgi:copper(I)-binding protein